MLECYICVVRACLFVYALSCYANSNILAKKVLRKFHC